MGQRRNRNPAINNKLTFLDYSQAVRLVLDNRLEILDIGTQFLHLVFIEFGCAVQILEMGTHSVNGSSIGDMHSAGVLVSTFST
jgi:hypothetical protein